MGSQIRLFNNRSSGRLRERCNLTAFLYVSKDIKSFEVIVMFTGGV
jgi:hypothetical protein